MNLKKYGKIMGVLAATTALVLSLVNDKKDSRVDDDK
ncbi:hypothetical protein U728_3227 [Clostridium botulinum 202F]|nr:hypothetical protein U728_3227 [Clostridium botulinum 202F]SJU80560.1 Uncharacterised protein [Clostridioides difficile]